MELIDYWKKVANNKEIYFKIKVSPSAKKTIFLGDRGDGVLKIAVKAVAEKGKANQELLNFIARSCHLNKNQLSLVKGINSHNKLIKIINL